MKESRVYSGHHELHLEVFDLQGAMAVHELSVTVCDCFNASRPNCGMLKATGSIGGSALGAAFFCALLLAGRMQSMLTLLIINTTVSTFEEMLTDKYICVISVILLYFIHIAGLLLLTLLLTCKKSPVTYLQSDTPGHLIKSNTESPGTDCSVNILVSCHHLLIIMRRCTHFLL